MFVFVCLFFVRIQERKNLFAISPKECFNNQIKRELWRTEANYEWKKSRLSVCHFNLVQIQKKNHCNQSKVTTTLWWSFPVTYRRYYIHQMKRGKEFHELLTHRVMMMANFDCINKPELIFKQKTYQRSDRSRRIDILQPFKHFT